MILAHPHSPARRRSAFTLLEVLVVVAIIMILASLSSVAVFQILKDNKKDQAALQCKTFDTAIAAFMLRNNENPPETLAQVLPYIKDGTENTLMDPWNKPYALGSETNANGVTTWFASTTDPDTSAQIRAPRK